MNSRSSGRRRSRGGRSNNRGPSDGNRQQGRNPGNAHQLCEKYKSMARDAHQQGDRVMNEYYLQFADHYFRVLTEFNAKKEEQRKEREEARQSHKGKDNKGKDHKAKGDADDRSDDGPQAEDGEQQPKKRQTRSRKKPEDANGAANGSEQEKIDADRLPGAISLDSGDEDGKSATKRRGRPPKSDDGEATAAE